jgi:uncharacterized protein YdeI (YjbR/CyaY-like superfamily)
MPIADAERVHAETREAWRAWLEANHRQTAGVYLVSWRKHTGKPTMPYGDSVEEALCFGWVDSVVAKLDADRSMLYFAPRKKGSGWSRPNKERVARLEAAGLLAPAGQAIIDAARADGSWTKLDDVENLIVPSDLAAALAQRKGATENWDAFPRSVRRGVLEWILQAKRPETRAARVTETADAAERNERAHQWRPK